jgi:hypothetical protein
MWSAELCRLLRAKDWREISQADRTRYRCQGSFESKSRSNQGKAVICKAEAIWVKGETRLD